MNFLVLLEKHQNAILGTLIVHILIFVWLTADKSKTLRLLYADMKRGAEKFYRRIIAQALGTQKVQYWR